MAPLSKQSSIVIEQIERLLIFLRPLLGLANCHMVDYFTKSCYTSYVPQAIQSEVDKVGHSVIINVLLNNVFQGKEVSCLKSYVENADLYTLKNCTQVCLGTNDFCNKVQKLGCTEFEQFKLEIFMTPKKSHEVEVMAAISASLSRLCQTSHIVDIGDGKGYLSSFLALHHKIPVLGIDASETNTVGADKRLKKLSRVWKNVKNYPRKSYPSKNDNAASPDVELYKQVTCFVDDSFDLNELIAKSFSEEPTGLGLVGLHTCGNLSPSCLRIFSTNNSIKTLCNVGCCYHLLDECFENDSAGPDLQTGFPMSSFLKIKKFSLGRSARMIAAQSVDRIMHSKELPNRSIYYRALLQVVLEKHCQVLPTGHVGRFRKPCQNFTEYTRRSLERLGVQIDIADEELEALDRSYEKRLDELNVFYLLRNKLSSVIECLILLDRLLFLYESGYEHSYLVQMFNPVTSPRCYGVVAFKM